jgi:hypothetical protein
VFVGADSAPELLAVFAGAPSLDDGNDDRPPVTRRQEAQREEQPGD